MSTYAEWKEKAEKQQKEYNDLYGSKEWEEIGKEEHFELMKKIGFATCGYPKNLAESSNFYTGYDADQIEFIEKIKNKIIEISDYDPIRFAWLFLILYWNKETSTIPVFRIVNSEGNIFVDTNGRVYKDWEDFKQNNLLPKCFYCSPTTGEYCTEMKVTFNESPAYSFSSKAISFIDTVATGAALGGTAASLFVAAPILTPLIGVATIYQAGRSCANLYDRKRHDQSINPVEREARNAWLNIASSVCVGGATAAVGKAKKIVDSGEQLSKLSIFGIKALNTSSLVFTGFGFVDNVFLCGEKYKKGTLSSLDVFQLSCEALFFCNAVSSVKATSKILEQMSTVKVPEGHWLKLKLRNYRKKVCRIRIKVQNKITNSQGSQVRKPPQSLDKKSTMLLSGMVNTKENEFILSGTLAALVYSMGRECLSDDLNYAYQSIGYYVKIWNDKKIPTENLLKFFRKSVHKIHELTMNAVQDVMVVLNEIKLKIKQYFDLACSEIQMQFCILIKKIAAKIISVLRNAAEEMAKLEDPVSEENKEDEENEEEIIADLEENCTEDDNELIAVFTSLEEKILPSFECKSLQDYENILQSVEAVVLEEFKVKIEEYKLSVEAAKKSSKDFKLDEYNKILGIEGDCAKFYFNKILESGNSKSLIFKIKKLLKNHKYQNQSIIEGEPSYLFAEDKGNIQEKEILQLIANKFNMKNLEEKYVNILQKQENGFKTLFIYPKDNSEKNKNPICFKGKKIEAVIVYYETNKDKTKVQE